MYQPIQLTSTIPSVRNSINRSPLRLTFLLISLALILAGFSLLPMAQAVTPAPDGGYPNNNTAEGDNALLNLTTGIDNTAIGFDALKSNTTGFGNTAIGFVALQLNTTGGGNVADGYQALKSNTTGGGNAAIGFAALQSNTTGINNTATGQLALQGNTNGRSNTADGAGALDFNSTGAGNTATGAVALYSNNGNNNTATGSGALSANTTGSNNTAEGSQALFNNTTGSNNIALGDFAGTNLTTGSNNIDIGTGGVAGQSNTLRIGNARQTATFIAGIRGVTVAGGVGVFVGTNGQLGTRTSSERFKEAIKPMDKTSEAILALKPVTFRYKKDLDPDGIPQFGLIAEQVEKVNPDLIVRDADGKINTVRYEAVNAMLLNEFLKEHRKLQEQEATVSQLKSTVAQQQKDFQETAAHQQKQIEVLTASLQKVSDQLERSKAAPQMVADNQ